MLTIEFRLTDKWEMFSSWMRDDSAGGPYSFGMKTADGIWIFDVAALYKLSAVIRAERDLHATNPDYGDKVLSFLNHRGLLLLLPAAVSDLSLSSTKADLIIIPEYIILPPNTTRNPKLR